VTAPEADPNFESLISYLGSTRGFDFSGYKRPTLIRRVQKRLDELQVASFNEYVDYLEVHVNEFELLFNTILINVTSFFRDSKSWDYLAETVVPQIVDSGVHQSTIRIWSAGCASGEEAYTLAILFAEALGDTEFRTRVKIYATDVDEEALSQARSGIFSAKALEGLPADLRDRYFTESGHEQSFRSDLRRSIIFGRHDLTRDAPISRLDLVTCRNTLMYFNAETQAKIIRRFYFALNPGGLLFLGRAEMLLSHADLFQPLSTPLRVFTKVPGSEAPLMTGEGTRAAISLGKYGAQTSNPLYQLAVHTMKIPQLIVDAEGIAVAINDAACTTLNLLPTDVGRPFQDLEVSYRPVDLRSPIESAMSERRPVELRAVELRGPERGPRYFDIIVAPIGYPGQPLLGSTLTFIEVTRIRDLQTELKRTSEELETAYEELQSTVEELETTNEELQSTVEELETTNEELQSTNEELETTNEELRSTNEELEATNEQLRVRTDEADNASNYLSSVVNGVSMGVVVVDERQIVRIWNVAAEETWGMRSDEVVGRALFDLDIGLPVDRLIGQLDTVTSPAGDMDDLVLDAVNRRGRKIRCRVRFTPLRNAERPGVVMLIEDVSD
jgi:two-component system, chemotaxis family, CheB/CheR fusion protein